MTARPKQYFQMGSDFAVGVDTETTANTYADWARYTLPIYQTSATEKTAVIYYEWPPYEKERRAANHAILAACALRGARP